MRPGQMTALVIQPSFFSGTVSLIASILLLGAANLPSVINQPAVHDYFLGSDGLVTLLRSSDSTSSLFSQSSFNNVITLLAALGFGVVVLIVLEIVRRVRADAAPISRHEARMRFGTRLLVTVVWLVYFVVTLKIIFPFCILASQVGVHALWGVRALGYIFFGVGLLWLCFHLHTVLMRLFVLRIRVFGGEEAIMEAELRR